MRCAKLSTYIIPVGYTRSPVQYAQKLRGGILRLSCLHLSPHAERSTTCPTGQKEVM